MSSSLPDVLEAAVPLMNQRRDGFDPFDPAYRERLLQWGLDQIAREIRPDPIFRPLDYARKAAAEREWRRVVRESGTAHRRVVAGAAAVIAQQQLEQIVWEFQEGRRQRVEEWNKHHRIDEVQQTTRFQTDERIREAEALARIAAQYRVEAPGADPLTVAAQFERKIAAIRVDATLSEEEKHQQTLFWQRAMEATLGSRGQGGRG